MNYLLSTTNSRIWCILFIFSTISGFSQCKASDDFLEIQEVVKIITPADKKIYEVMDDTPIDVEFLWEHNNSDGATDQYEFWIEHELIKTIDAKVEDTTYSQTIPLSVRGDCLPYKWFVRAENDFQYSNTEQLENFMLLIVTPSITVHPENEIHLQCPNPLELSWEHPCYTSFDVILSTEPDLSKDMILQERVEGYSYSYTEPLEMGKTYYWQVTGIWEGFDHETPSEIQSFTIDVIEDVFLKTQEFDENTIKIYFQEGTGTLVKDLKINDTPIPIEGDVATVDRNSFAPGEYTFTYTVQVGICGVDFFHPITIKAFCSDAGLSNWREVQLTGMTPYVNEPGAVYDSENQRIIYIAGIYTFTIDVSDIDAVTWKQMPFTLTVDDSQPDNMMSQLNMIEGVTILDKTRNRILLVHPMYSLDSWELSLDLNLNSEYTVLNIFNEPSEAKYDQMACLDDEDHYLYFSGGQGMDQTIKRDPDMYRLDISSTPSKWEELSFDGDITEGVTAAQIIYLSDMRSILLFGGRLACTFNPEPDMYPFLTHCSDKLWLYSLDDMTVKELTPTGNPRPKLHEFDMIRLDQCRILIIGGSIGDGLGDPRSKYYYIFDIKNNTWSEFEYPPEVNPRSFYVNVVKDEARHLLIMVQANWGVTHKVGKSYIPNESETIWFVEY